VVLARLFAEDRHPTPQFWAQSMVSSRLLAYEVMVRAHARAAMTSVVEDARHLIDQISLVELAPAVISRSLEPFPTPVRTLDALHLSTMVFLRANEQSIEVATYDKRLATAAVALGFPLADV
jgi:hypothetical protein